MAAVFNLVMATLRVGEIHYNLSTLSQIHNDEGELMYKIQFFLNLFYFFVISHSTKM